MPDPPVVPDIDDGNAETAALKRAIEEARADGRFVPHDGMRAWLLRIAAGEMDAPSPEPR